MNLVFINKLVNYIYKIKNSINNKVTPDEYFNYLKDNKHSISMDELNTFLDKEKNLVSTMLSNNQIMAAEHLIFHITNIEREQKAIAMGFNKYIYRKDLDYYMDTISQLPTTLKGSGL